MLLQPFLWPQSPIVTPGKSYMVLGFLIGTKKGCGPYFFSSRINWAQMMLIFANWAEAPIQNFMAYLVGMLSTNSFFSLS